MSFLAYNQLPLPKCLNSYIIKSKIGTGSFSSVYLAINKYTDENVAIKIFDKSSLQFNITQLSPINSEISILKQLNHKNIVKLYEILESEHNIYLIIEYCEGVDLFTFISSNKSITEEKAYQIFHQLIDSLSYMHKMNICHRNLKLENIIYNESNNTIKLIDFAYSTYYFSNEIELNENCGSPNYACPEMHKGISYIPEKADVWSCGVLLYIMVCGFMPFDCDCDDNCDGDNVKSFESFEIPINLSSDIVNLLTGMLEENEEKRFAFSDVISHNWFNSTKNRGKENLVGGLNEFELKIPVDERILNICSAMGFDKEEIRDDVRNNKYNENTVVYKLCLKKVRDNGMSSVSDLCSDEFKQYLMCEENYLSIDERERVKKEFDVNELQRRKDVQDQLDELICKEEEALKMLESISKDKTTNETSEESKILNNNERENKPSNNNNNNNDNDIVNYKLNSAKDTKIDSTQIQNIFDATPKKKYDDIISISSSAIPSSSKPDLSFQKTLFTPKLTTPYTKETLINKNSSDRRSALSYIPKKSQKYNKHTMNDYEYKKKLQNAMLHPKRRNAIINKEQIEQQIQKLLEMEASVLISNDTSESNYSQNEESIDISETCPVALNEEDRIKKQKDFEIKQLEYARTELKKIEEEEEKRKEIIQEEKEKFLIEEREKSEYQNMMNKKIEEERKERLNMRIQRKMPLIIKKKEEYDVQREFEVEINNKELIREDRQKYEDEDDEEYIISESSDNNNSNDNDLIRENFIPFNDNMIIENNNNNSNTNTNKFNEKDNEGEISKKEDLEKKIRDTQIIYNNNSDSNSNNSNKKDNICNEIDIKDNKDKRMEIIIKEEEVTKRLRKALEEQEQLRFALEKETQKIKRAIEEKEKLKLSINGNNKQNDQKKKIDIEKLSYNSKREDNIKQKKLIEDKENKEKIPEKNAKLIKKTKEREKIKKILEERDKKKKEEKEKEKIRKEEEEKERKKRIKKEFLQIEKIRKENEVKKLKETRDRIIRENIEKEKEIIKEREIQLKQKEKRERIKRKQDEKIKRKIEENIRSFKKSLKLKEKENQLKHSFLTPINEEVTQLNKPNNKSKSRNKQQNILNESDSSIEEKNFDPFLFTFRIPIKSALFASDKKIKNPKLSKYNYKPIFEFSSFDIKSPNDNQRNKLQEYINNKPTQLKDKQTTQFKCSDTKINTSNSLNKTSINIKKQKRKISSLKTYNDIANNIINMKVRKTKTKSTIITNKNNNFSFTFKSNDNDANVNLSKILKIPKLPSFNNILNDKQNHINNTFYHHRKKNKSINFVFKKNDISIKLKSKRVFSNSKNIHTRQLSLYDFDINTTVSKLNSNKVKLYNDSLSPIKSRRETNDNKSSNSSDNTNNDLKCTDNMISILPKSKSNINNKKVKFNTNLSSFNVDEYDSTIKDYTTNHTVNEQIENDIIFTQEKNLKEIVDTDGEKKKNRKKNSLKNLKGPLKYNGIIDVLCISQYSQIESSKHLCAKLKECNIFFMQNNQFNFRCSKNKTSFDIEICEIDDNIYYYLVKIKKSGINMQRDIIEKILD